jgi:adenylate cyclase
MSAEQKTTRKLRAILSADVKGYSLLMADDEAFTIQTLQAYRKLMSDLIIQHSGRVVDSPGDNLLAEFPSAVDAIECTVAIQKRLKKENDRFVEGKRLEFRMGVNIGDVVHDGGRIYGSGVNVAARIEGLADAGGICISRNTYDHVKDKLDLGFEYLGEHDIKNIKEPVQVYKILMEPETNQVKRGQRSREPASEEKMAYPLPDKPSIAVLPFTNMSGDPNQEYIGDGFSENIIDALSVGSKIFVIARNSTFTYKGKPVKVQQVAEDLGVQYILEGSIQKSGERLRVTAQLIDALTGHHLWSEKYDRKMEDIFDLQDEVTKKVVVSLQVELTHGEDVRMSAKSTENLEAWKNYIKGSDLFEKISKEDNLKARELFRTALKIDPGFVSALARIAPTHIFDANFGWSNSTKVSTKRAFEVALQALKMDEQNPDVHGVLGYVYLYQRQYEKAVSAGERAIALNPNFAVGHVWLGITMHYAGRFEKAIELMEKAYRLNPKLHPNFLIILNRSYIYLRRYEEALKVINQMEEHASRGKLAKWIPPFAYSFLCIELGREEEARDHMAKALKINPNLSLEDFIIRNPYKHPAHLKREADARLAAGLPKKRSPGAVP